MNAFDERHNGLSRIQLLYVFFFFFLCICTMLLLGMTDICLAYICYGCCYQEPGIWYHVVDII